MPSIQPRTPGTCLVVVVLILALGSSVSAVASPPTDAGADPPLPLYELDLTLPDAMERLTGTKLDLIEFRPYYRATVLGWPGALEIMEEAGLCPKLTYADYGKEVANRARGHRSRPVVFRGRLATSSATASTTVPPFGSAPLPGTGRRTRSTRS